jgi:hypothetical protein
LKTIRHRRWLIALLVIIVGVLVGLDWLVWPEPPPKDLALRLEFVRGEVVDGNNKLLFRIAGADECEISITGLLYLNGPDCPPSRETFDTLSTIKYSILSTNNSYLLITNIHYMNASKEFYADPPLYSPYHAQVKLNAAVLIFLPETTLNRISRVMKDTWRLRRRNPTRLTSTVKMYWQARRATEQKITSDVIINTPSH